MDKLYNKREDIVLRGFQLPIKEILRYETRWKPECGDEYWFVDADGDIQSNYWGDSCADDFRYDTNNCFKLLEDAEKRKENISTEVELRKLVEELNDGEEIDWKNENQWKRYLIYNNKNDCIEVYYTQFIQNPKGIYCIGREGRDFREMAIEKIGEERLKKYLMEE